MQFKTNIKKTNNGFKMKKNMDKNERVGRGILDKNIILKINFDSRKSFVGV